MEDKDLQKIEQKEVEEKEVEKKEVETPKGFYLGEVVTGTAKIIALDGKPVDEQELLIKMANILKDQLGMK